MYVLLSIYYYFFVGLSCLYLFEITCSVNNSQLHTSEKLFKQVDGNGNGCIDLEEFIGFLDPKQEQKNVKDAFKAFDKDGNGYLSGSELREAMVVLGMDIENGKVAKLFKIIDSISIFYGWLSFVTILNHTNKSK
jgi:hypothetical protein